MWQIFTTLYLDASKFAPTYYSSVMKIWFSTCRMMQKGLGRTKTKGKRDITKSTSRKAKGTEFCVKMCYERWPTQACLPWAWSIWTFCCSPDFHSCPISSLDHQNQQSNLYSTHSQRKIYQLKATLCRFDENNISNFSILMSSLSTKKNSDLFMNTTARVLQ